MPQNVSVEDSRLVIPKFKEGIRLNLHRKIEDVPLFATVSRSTTGKSVKHNSKITSYFRM